MKTALFSSAINLKLEPELHRALTAAARDEHTTLSEFARRAIADRIASVSPDDPGPFRPAPGQRIAA